MKRPHADLIHAWADLIHVYADGAEIQEKVTTEWKDIQWPDFHPDYEWRIKPEPKPEPKPDPKKYRVALCICSPCIVFNEEQAASLSGMRGFIKWLDDWKYYEGKSC